MIRVHLQQRLISDCLEVFVVDQQDGMRRVLHQENAVDLRWDEVGPPGAAVQDAILEPTFVLPWDSGRALLDALTRHYEGAEDTRTLRRDYDAERKRVDEQAKVIADIAKVLAGRRAS